MTNHAHFQTAAKPPRINLREVLVKESVQSTTVSLDELVNRTEVGDETHQVCNTMKETMMGQDHASKPIVIFFILYSHYTYIHDSKLQAKENNVNTNHRRALELLR